MVEIHHVERSTRECRSHHGRLLNFQNNGGVSIESFHPTLSPRANLNDHSIVTVIEYEAVKILSPRNNELSSWSELLV